MNKHLLEKLMKIQTTLGVPPSGKLDEETLDAITDFIEENKKDE